MRYRSRPVRHVLGATLALALALVAGALHAQDYPSRTIRIVVPSARGGAGDSIARLLAERLGSVLRAPVIVENRPGASGLVGNEYVMRAPPDGYTLLFATSATHVITAFTMDRLPYDPQRDFMPVINAAYATSCHGRRELASGRHAPRLHRRARARARGSSTTLHPASGRRITSTPRRSRRWPASR